MAYNRQLRDAIARRFPHRAGRRIQTISALIVELMAQGWVAGESAAAPAGCTGSRSRGGRLGQLALWVIEEFVREPEDRRYLVLAALRMIGFVPVGSPEALADDAARQAKDGAPQPVPDATIR